MKRFLSVLAFVTALSGAACAQENANAVSIPILNPSFDGDDMSCTPGASCYENSATGWLCGPSAGVAKFSTVQYPSAPADGIYVAAIGGSYVTGSILQTLGVTVQANTTYVLTLRVGARADYPFTGYLAALMAGNVTLGANNTAPLGGSFVTDVVRYSSGPNPAQLGEPLQILVKSLGTGQVDIGF